MVSPATKIFREPAEATRASRGAIGAATKTASISYRRSRGGVDAYVSAVSSATPMQIVEIERRGVMGSFIKDLSKRMEVPSSRIYTILGLPKATAEKKAAAGELVNGTGGQAAVGMIRLLGIAQEMVRNSTAVQAKGFDAAKWLGRWLEQPQPALGGRKAADLIDTPTGVEVVARLLGSIESGAYQ
jgi:putative toxin-antitoxin system antitoxin component (TIGR02293 family)